VIANKYFLRFTSFVFASFFENVSFVWLISKNEAHIFKNIFFVYTPLELTTTRSIKLENNIIDLTRVQKVMNGVAIAKNW
jgi:hypothetical protein